MRILVVDDETEIAHDIGKALVSAGYFVEYSADGEDAWFKGSTENFSAVILDLGLPKMDGLTVLKNWRREKIGTPVIILTARGNWTDRVDGIELGADDYLAKPFHIEELVARVRALIRRSAGVSNPNFEIGNLRVDMRSSIATRDGAKLDLGPLEFRLLAHLLLHRGKVRDVYALGSDELLIVATDRLSAFDVVLGAIPGLAGLGPTRTALEAGRHVALANKEAMVCGGPLMWQVARNAGCRSHSS